MKSSLIFLALISGTLFITSCKKPDEVMVEEPQAYTQTNTPENRSLAGAMKKASLQMRRLAKAVKNDDWIEIDTWTRELKQGIGFNCVELYMIENNDIPHEFTILSNKFNSAINKLMLSGKKRDADNAGLEFNNLIKSCDSCHEGFNKGAETKLDFDGS